MIAEASLLSDLVAYSIFWIDYSVVGDEMALASSQEIEMSFSSGSCVRAANTTVRN